MKIINWLLIAFRKRMHWCRPTCIMRTCGVRLLFNIQYVMSSQSQRYVELCYILLRYKVQTERTKRGSTLELLPILFCRCIGSPMTAKKSTSIHSIIGLLSPEQHRYLPYLLVHPSWHAYGYHAHSVVQFWPGTRSHRYSTASLSFTVVKNVKMRSIQNILVD